MIPLHDIQPDKIKLTDLQLMTLGDGLIEGFNMRLRVDHRDQVTVQRYYWWGTAVRHDFPDYYTARERNTRLRRGRLAMEEGVEIYYTPAARLRRGLP